MKTLHFPHIEQPRRLLTALAANLAIVLLWLWLFRPVYAYLGTIFTRQEFRTNQVVLIAVLALIFVQSRRGRLQITLGSPPQLHLAGLGLALGGAAAFLAAERWLDINTLSASLFALASYGLLGLWMDGRAWRRGLPAALLLVGVFPFGEHMETFIGYPMRLATARLVGQGLSSMGVQHLGVDTILILENGLSQVDSPCSGVKSLWSGGLFLLAATWIEGRRINRRWVLAAIAFVLLLLAANLGRVAILTLVGAAGGWRLLAEMLHVPLGVIGFAAACFAALGMLRWAGARVSDESAGSILFKRPKWLAPALAAVLIGLLALYAPRPKPAAAAAFAWQFPTDMVVQDWPLNNEETNWLSGNGALPVAANRWRFEYRGLKGSLLLVASSTWRAHHRPEDCFTVYGLDVQESQLRMAEDDFPLRWLSLGMPGDSLPSYSAAYWLQSEQVVTDDYAMRMWDDLAPQPEPWVLVTVLFDEPVEASALAVDPLFSTLRQSVQAGLRANEERR